MLIINKSTLNLCGLCVRMYEMHMQRLEKMKGDSNRPRKNISPTQVINPMNNGSEGASRFLTSRIQA